MSGGDQKQTFKQRQKSLSMHFNSIFTRKIKVTEAKEQKYQLKENVQSLLKDLGLEDYYPQKLTYSDVIKVTEDDLKEVNEKPTTLSELPWYFMRRVIGLNSTIREKGSDLRRSARKRKRKRNSVSKRERDRRKAKKRKHSEEISFCWKNDSEKEDAEDEDSNPRKISPQKSQCSVYPLDLIYVIFLCADDFLRQELAEKMSKCQYAVPFILPSAVKMEESENVVLHWGLQTISKTFCEESCPVMSKNILNVCCPLVSCLSLNSNSTRKLRLVNQMLSPHQETFWHESLEGGERIQNVSQGMVEVSWHLPAGRGNDQFRTPVTFANLRGDARQSPW